MPIAFWCVLVAGLLPIFTIAPAKWLHAGTFDNARPRDPAFYRDGFRARAHGAHLNGFEAFPFFAAAVLVAHALGSDPGWLDVLAGAFILARLAYIGFYYADWPTARSVAWTAGFFATIAIFLLPVIAG